MINQATIDLIKDRLVNAYKPLEIYVFGSYAWGSPNEDSDLDLLVIVDNLESTHYEALVKGHRSLRGIYAPKDILILTKLEFDAGINSVSSLSYKIKKEGKKIYAKA